MSDQPTPSPSNDPEWLEEFEQLANEQLGHGSACQQVHPIVERWYNELMEKDPPASRDSIMQALSCLSTEIMYDSPSEVLDAVLEYVTGDDLALWIEHVLLIGRAFEIALRKGELDDL